jgi:hypothetical protein
MDNNGEDFIIKLPVMKRSGIPVDGLDYTEDENGVYSFVITPSFIKLHCQD